MAITKIEFFKYNYWNIIIIIIYIIINIKIIHIIKLITIIFYDLLHYNIFTRN